LKIDWKIILIISLAIILIFPQVAISNDFDIEDLDPPDDYGELLERYRDMAQIALSYKKLYEEAEQDVIRLEQRVESVMLQLERQQDLIEVQDELINDLLSAGGNNLFITAGFNYLPVRNERQVYVGLQYQIAVPFF